MKPNMHPTETEKAQPVCRVVPSKGYLPMFDVYYGEHRLSAHSTEKAAKLEAARLNDLQRKVLAARTPFRDMVDADFARELERRCAGLEWLLSQFLGSLPTRRDWLDPDLEKAARAAVEKGKGNL